MGTFIVNVSRIMSSPSKARQKLFELFPAGSMDRNVMESIPPNVGSEEVVVTLDEVRESVRTCQHLQHLKGRGLHHIDFYTFCAFLEQHTSAFDEIVGGTKILATAWEGGCAIASTPRTHVTDRDHGKRVFKTRPDDSKWLPRSIIACTPIQ